MVEFAEEVSRAVGSVINAGVEGLEISVDVGITVYRTGVVLLPLADYYAGGGGASERSGTDHLGGRGRDLGFDTLTKFSLGGTDQAASVSGES